MDYELPMVFSDLPQEISEYVGRFNESDQLNGCNDCFTADVMSHNKWPSISNDAKSRGFKARPPDSHAPTRGHVRYILMLNFPPVGNHGDVRVLCLGPDGLFLQPSLNAAVRSLINLLVATKRFDKDVARCLIMTSVIVVDSVFSEGFSNWHAKNEDDFINVAVNTHDWVKEIIMDCIINKCPNLVGVIGMGKYPFTAMDWMRTELEDKRIYVSHRKLGHPQLTLFKHDIIISVNELNLKSNSTKIYSTWLALFFNEIMSLKIFRRKAEDLPDDTWRDIVLGIDEISILIDSNDYDVRQWSWNEIIVKTTDTILQVKMKIEHQLGIPVHKQQLLSKTDTSDLELKILVDDKTLADYGRTKNGMRLKLNIIGDNGFADNIEEMPRGFEVEIDEEAMEVEV